MDFRDLTVIDFSDLVQDCKNYEEFVERMRNASVPFIKPLSSSHSFCKLLQMYPAKIASRK